MSIERFYCQEYDCGKGFSATTHLESHTRFFHPKKPTKTTERVKEAVVLSNNIPDADEKSTGQSPAYSSPTSEIIYPLLEESTKQWSPGPVETYVPDLPRERYQGSESDTEEFIEQAHEDLLEPPATIRGGACATSAMTALTPLSLQCRVCDALPTVGSRPTVTMCGHLFCSECITRHVMSTSKCPVCDEALLLYCLFKLDLPVPS